MKTSLLVLLASWLALAAAEGGEHVFPANAETTYKYTTEVSTGVTLPGTHENHASYFAHDMKLRVRTDGTNKVFFKIEDVHLSAYNGAVKKDKSPEGEHKFVEKCKDCGKPFAAVYEKGQIKEVELSETDKLFVRNQKRALLTQFQLDFEHIPPKRAFTSQELGVNGLCFLEQSMQTHPGEDYFTVRKFFNNNNCTNKPEREENLTFKECETSARNAVSHTTERNYKLGRNHKALFVKTIKSRSGIVTQPHGFDTEAYFQITTQKLALSSSDPVHDDAWEMGTTITTSLAFEFPNEVETGEDMDMSFGSIVYNPEQMLDKTLSILKQLAERLDTKEAHKLRAEELHALDIKRKLATTYLRSMNTETLKTLSDKIIDTEDVTMRQLAVEVLPTIGTLAAARVVKRLKEVVTEDEFEYMLGEVPFHLRHHSEEIIELFSDLKDSDDSDEVLAFTALVGEVFDKAEISQEIIDKLVDHYMGKVRDSEEYGDKLLYVQALNNIRADPVAKSLEPMIADKVNYPHTLRFAAVWAAQHSHSQQPDKAYELYWPILEDKTEHSDMRHAALTMLLLSKPTTERFLNLLWFISSTRDPDLYNMFYTAVQSLFETKHPCFSQLTFAVDEVMRLMPQRDVPSYSSYNSIWDYEDPHTGDGFKFQSVLISDEKTGYPSVLYFDGVPHYNGLVGNAFSIHLRLDGNVLRDTIGKARQWNTDDKSTNSPIFDMLQSLGIVPRVAEPTHVEIMLKVQGRTILCGYLDEINLEKLFAVLGMGLMAKILQTDMSEPIVIPISDQALYLSTTFETVVANDVGLPVTIFMQKPSLFSWLGNFTFVLEGKKISLHTNVGFRYLGHQSQGMIGLNPTNGVWQGVTRSRSADVYLPIENTLFLDVTKQTAGLVFEWKEDQSIISSLSHMHTITYVMGPVHPLIPLETFCTDCEIIHIVSTGTPENVTQAKTKFAGSQFEYDMNIFDCENPEELESFDLLWERITSDDNKNVRTAENYKYLLGLMEVFDLTDRLPSTGSCGQSTRVTAVGKARKLEMTFTVEEKQTVGDIQYIDGDGKAINAWHWTYESSENVTNDVEHQASKLQLRHKEEGEPYYMICIKTDQTTNKDLEEDDFYDLLYKPLSGTNTMHLSVNIGQSPDGKCPQQTGSQILISGSSTPRKPRNNEAMTECEEERGKNRLYPATENCVKAAEHSVFARNVTINVQTSNIKKEVAEVGKSLLARIHRRLPDTIPERLPSEFTIDLESNGEGKTAVWVTGAENPGQWFDEELPVWFSSRFKTNANRKVQQSQTCVAASDHVYTYDNTPIKYDGSTKWTLMTADCVSSPQFAVFIRKVEGSDVIAASVHLLDDVIEVTPSKTSTVLVNGEPFHTWPEDSSLKITIEKGVVRVTRKDLTLKARISTTSVTVTTTYDYAGFACGVCGDYNKWPETSLNFPGPDGKPVDLENVTRVYTLPSHVSLTTFHIITVKVDMQES